MKRATLITVLFVSACFTNTAAAQELPLLTETLSNLDGTEVQVGGGIGTFVGDTFYIRIEDGSFPLDFALSRSDLASIEGCELGFSGENCRVDVSAEVKVDGSSIRLLVFELRNLVRN